MPIAGVVITAKKEGMVGVTIELDRMTGVDIHGSDVNGNIVAVLESDDSFAMEAMIDRINGYEDVLTVGLTYLNTEDEAEKMAQGTLAGEMVARPVGFRSGMPPLVCSALKRD